MVHPTTDRHFRPDILSRGRARSPFHVFGVIGLLSGTGWATALAVYLGFSPGVVWVLIGVAIAVLLATVLVVKVLTGEETLKNYRDQALVVLAVVGVLKLLNQPVLLYLDIFVLGLGIFLAWGRAGCLWVGCCHGRPHPWGVRYGEAHAQAGFASHLKDVRLLPVQAFEGVLWLAIVLAGTALLLGAAPTGLAFSVFVVGYALGRFVLEFWRGDTARPYWGRFSQAQWTALVAVWVVVSLAVSGRLPIAWWQIAAAIALPAAMIVITWHCRQAGFSRLDVWQPRHVREVALALASLRSASSPEAVKVVTTTAGLQLSRGEAHYTISHLGGAMSPDTAAAVAALIARLGPSKKSFEIREGRHAGVFHLPAGGPELTV